MCNERIWSINPLNHQECDFFIYFFIAVIICPKQFECVLCFLQSQQSTMGKKCMGCFVRWFLLLSMYIVCHHLQSMDPCATCCFTVYMIWDREAYMWFALATGPDHLSHRPLTLAIFNREIMDLECFGKFAQSVQRKTFVPTFSVWFNCRPPHREIICRWFDVVLNRHGLVYFKWGFALQNTLITPIIFDIAVNHDLRRL